MFLHVCSLACAVLAFSMLPLAAADRGKVPVPKIQLSHEQWSEWARTEDLQIATFGTGCFWCTEAAFEILPGVVEVVSGYAGGSVSNPSYEQVLSKGTGHAEVCHVFFDPQTIRYQELLKLFFKIHDPTSLNKQGADVGPQYRSVIFTHDAEQEQLANAAIEEQDKKFVKKIVTAVEPFRNFYMAEAYHQDYFANNPRASYCQQVVRAKVGKAKRFLSEELKVKPE